VREETQWVLNWFRRKLKSGDVADEDLLHWNYFEKGLIDSLGVIELVAEIETKYKIRFTDRHFQDRRFATVEGLAAIVAELVGGKAGA
jgi:acyl carrier protein